MDSCWPSHPLHITSSWSSLLSPAHVKLFTLFTSPLPLMLRWACFQTNYMFCHVVIAPSELYLRFHRRVLLLLVLEIHSWDNSYSRSCFENMLKNCLCWSITASCGLTYKCILVKRFNLLRDPFVPSSSPGLSQKCLWKVMCFVEQLCSPFLLEQAEFLFRTTHKGHGLAWGWKCWDSWNIPWRSIERCLRLN